MDKVFSLNRLVGLIPKVSPSFFLKIATHVTSGAVLDGAVLHDPFSLFLAGFNKFLQEGGGSGGQPEGLEAPL